MKRLFLIILVVGFCASSIFAKEVGNFDISVQNDKIDVKNSLMTYYFLRLESQDGTKKTNPILILPADSKVKLEIKDNLKWKGIIPKFDIDFSSGVGGALSKYVKINTEKKSINPTTYQGWENSKITLQGANFLEIGNQNKYHWSSTASLFTLNSLQLTKIVMEGAINANVMKSMPTKAIILSNKFKNIKKNFEDFVFFLNMVEANLEISEAVIEGYSKAGEPLPIIFVYFKDYYTIFKEIISSSSEIMGNIETNANIKKEIKKRMVYEYKKDKGLQRLDDVSDKVLSNFSQELADDLKGNKTKAQKALMAQKVIASIEAGMAEYEKYSLEKFKTEKEKKVFKSKIRNVKIAILGLSIISNTATKYNEDPNLEKALFGVLKDLAIEAYSELFGDIPAIVSKKINNGSLISKSFVSVSAGFQLGNTVGNKFIPFMYDWFMSPNYLSADIVNKNIILYPNIHSKLLINNTSGDVIYDSTQNTTTQNILYVNKNDTISVNAFMQQDYLFDSERSPWYLKTFLTRQSLWDARIRYDDVQQIYLKNCITESLEYFDAYMGSGILTGTPLISQSRFTEADAEKIENHSCSSSSNFIEQLRYTPWSINEVYKIKNLINPVLTYQIVVNDLNKILFVSFNGYENGLINTYKINFQTLDIPILTTKGDGSASYSIGNLNLAPNDSIVKYVWEINNSGKYITTQSSTLFNTEVPTGAYTVKVWIYTASGNIIPKEISIDSEVSQTSTLKKTGQTKSYTPFDDGYYQTGVTPSYTRDDSKEIVTDNITGFMWQDDSEAKTLYLSWQGAKDYCDGSTLGGYSDWRLPAVEELESIVDYGRNNPSIDPTFKNVENAWYWSSTSPSGYTYGAWVVYFNNGIVSQNNKDNNDYLRCVRAGR